MARTDSLPNFLTDISKAIKNKKKDETPIPAKDFDKEIENLITGGVAPMNVKNLVLKPGDSSLKLTWTDPEDTYDDDGTLLVTWAGTKVMYKTNGYPTNPNDGTLIVDSTTKNAYKANPLEINDLTNNTTYYISLFTYSDTGIYNENIANRISGTPSAIPAKVPFATATDDEVKTIIEAHYKGLINIEDYWNVGDTRKMHLNAMAKGTGADETHVAQDMTMVIIGLNHDNLKTEINGRTKAAITLQCKELLGNNGSAEYAYIWGSSTSTANDSNYSKNPRRTWLNGTFVNSLPSYVQSLVKTVVKKNLANHNASPGAGPDTEDKAFLTSYTEMFGNAAYSYYMNNKKPNNEEGEQYSYYSSNAKRTKYWNNNGTASSSAYPYWLRSPSSLDAAYWFSVLSDGSATSSYSHYTYGLAPAFCL